MTDEATATSRTRACSSGRPNRRMSTWSSRHSCWRRPRSPNARRSGRCARSAPPRSPRRWSCPCPRRSSRPSSRRRSRPALVVAGAGSGKTETMANRVVWLLANGHVRVPEILGLTFTRKAAGELGRAHPHAASSSSSRPGSTDVDFDPFDAPDRRHLQRVRQRDLPRQRAAHRPRARVGRAQRGVRLAARPRVSSSPAPTTGSSSSTAGSTRSPSAVARPQPRAQRERRRRRPTSADGRAVRRARRAAHGQRPGEGAVRLGALRGRSRRLAAAAARPRATRSPTRSGAAASSSTPTRSRSRSRSANASPTSSPTTARRYRVVLLDEYQDTSVVQTRLLSGLFAGRPVMAVGDPHQSIYGWRGASAANLGRLRRRLRRAPATRVRPTYALSTSWRNPTRVLDAANTLVGTAHRRVARARRAARSRARARRRASSTAAFERDRRRRGRRGRRLVRRAARASATPTASRRPPRCSAARSRRSTSFTAALARHGIPYHVLGLGGLLRAARDRRPRQRAPRHARPDRRAPSSSGCSPAPAGASAPEDLAALRDVASWLAAARPPPAAPRPPRCATGCARSVAGEEGASLVDALDFVARSARRPRSRSRASAPDGLERLRDAGPAARHLRSRVGLDLLDLVDPRAAGAAARHRGGGERDRAARPGEPRRLRRAGRRRYLAADDQATLGSLPLLARRGRAARQPGAAQRGARARHRADPHHPRREGPRVGRRRRAAPGRRRAARRRRRAGRAGCRSASCRTSSAATRPSCRCSPGATAETQKEFDDADRRVRGRERRRATSPRSAGSSTSPSPARSDAPAADRVVLVDADEAPRPRRRTCSSCRRRACCPATRSPTRRARREPARASRRDASVAARSARRPPTRVEAAAAAVRRARRAGRGRRRRLRRATSTCCSPSAPAGAAEAGLVGCRRASRPPASRTTSTDPAAVAAALRRPMPERPYRQTRLGTLFHAWVEERFGTIAGARGRARRDERRARRPRRATSLEAERLAALQATFERERVGRTPTRSRSSSRSTCRSPGRSSSARSTRSTGRGRRHDYQIVDWKTGKAPRDADDLERKQLQLALYRLAYARYAGIDPEHIDAVFYFVADDRVVRPERLYSEEELTSLWSSATGFMPRRSGCSLRRRGRPACGRASPRPRRRP